MSTATAAELRAPAPPAADSAPLSRRWLWLVGTVALVGTFLQAPGQIAPDTKLDLTANPLRFLARATNLWNSELPFGQAQNQAYGYLFPHGTFFLAGDVLGLPGWVTQRLWWALLLAVGFWGLLRVAEALRIGSPTSRVLAAAAFALCPRVLTTLGSISSETLPMMLAPWVLLPVIVALRGGPAPRSLRVLAGQAALAMALMGAVNAVATLAGCLPALIWWACHRPDRRWWAFTGWAALAAALASLWWLTALVALGRISPPFLDFIESSGVTTQWTSLTEMLRGTAAWTPFVAPDATAGTALVTGPLYILATGLVAAAGLAGLALAATGLGAGRRHPAAGRLVTMLLVGVMLLGLGYAGGLGSPLATPVQEFLDAAGAPLRNVHKLESVIRIPLTLGLAVLLGRIPLPGSAPSAQWRTAFAHPERDKRVAVGIVVLCALLTATSLAWTGRLTPPGTFTAIPSYWQQAADWLDAHNTGRPTPGRVLVVPGAPFATQVWGSSHDEPLQVLGDSPWAVRDSIPLTPPQAIRAFDSVQRLLAGGRPSAGLADTLIRQGIAYLVVRNDLDPDTSRSARPILVHQAIEGSPGLSKVAEFGEPVGPGTLDGFVIDSGLRPTYPPVEIYRVESATNPAAPYLVDADTMARIDGGPEVLARLDERQRLLGAAPLGPALLTADARRAGLAAPTVTVTDTPVARETDYGRVDHHSSAARALDERRHTHNRVPDYPVPDTPLVVGAWTGGRLTASSSAADATALPNVSPASAPAAAVDGDSATAWVSNSLQAAVGQWLQVDFDHPVTSGSITVTPSATAVGAQVRRIQVETPNGTTTLTFDEAGRPLSTALPYGETPWVRLTATGTDDGSPGVQFGITDLAVTAYDASGFAHPVELRHTLTVPGPPPGSTVTRWDLGSELLGRPGCAEGPDGVRCAASMGLSPEEEDVFSRTLTVVRPITVRPTVWLRPRQGPQLADLLAAPGVTRSFGDSDLIDVLGSSYAATDGDPDTAWSAPQQVVRDKTPPTLTLRLPTATRVTGLRVVPARSEVPTTPSVLAVDLGDGPQVRTLDAADRGPTTLPVAPHVTDTVTVSLLDWDDVIDRTALGFDQLKPPGLAEITVLGADGAPVAAADRDTNRSRPVRVDCAHGPVIAVAGRFVHTAISTTVGALLDGGPVAAHACDDTPITLPLGRQELLISPGSAFIVDGARLTGAHPETPAAPTTPVTTGVWRADHRELRVPAAEAARVLVVPESVNPGWRAHTDDGTALTAVTVNGWQQGWVLPAGTSGPIILSFASNTGYRLGLLGGLALLPLVALLALVGRRTRAHRPARPTRPWAPGPLAATAAALSVGTLIAGPVGTAVFAAALAVRRLRRGAAVTVGLAAAGLTVAAAALARYPWRSVDGYIGHSAGVQLAALVSVAAVAAAALPGRRPDRGEP